MCVGTDDKPEKLQSFTEFNITAAKERDQTIRNFIDIANFDRNSSGKSTFVEHESLDALNDMVAGNLYCPETESDKMTKCTTMQVGKSYMSFEDFLRNEDGKGVAL